MGYRFCLELAADFSLYLLFLSIPFYFQFFLFFFTDSSFQWEVVGGRILRYKQVLPHSASLLTNSGGSGVMQWSPVYHYDTPLSAAECQPSWQSLTGCDACHQQAVSTFHPNQQMALTLSCLFVARTQWLTKSTALSKHPSLDCWISQPHLFRLSFFFFYVHRLWRCGSFWIGSNTV